jgi:D-tyrosyl-tRNA(Tyr) deacylase
MRAVIQRVARAQVSVDGAVVGKIDRGLVVLLGVAAADTETDLEWLLAKVLALRVFPDAAGKMNLDLAQAGGALLVVSQFTLLGDVRKGNRPAFTAAKEPVEAERLYRRFCERAIALGARVERGVFRADMQVELVNDGPVTLLLDSTRLF